MLAFLFCLVSLSVFAENRSSNISIGENSGSNSYKSQALDTVIGVSPEFQITGSYFQSDSGVANLGNEKLTTKEGRLGVDWKFHSSTNAFLEGIRRQDPYKLNSRGFKTGLGSNVSDFWQGKRQTRISFSVQQLSYTQTGTYSGARTTINIHRTVQQKSGTIALAQEVFDWFETRLSFTQYNYSGGSSNLSSATLRRRTAAGSGGPTYGLTDRSASLTLTFLPWEWAETSLTGTRTKILSDDNSESKSGMIAQTFFWKEWSLEIDYTQTTYTNNVSGTDPSTQNFTAVYVGYSW